jgi:2-iminobutanoate/2-iminopropanoate deaminase
MLKEVIHPEGVPVHGVYTPAFRIRGGDLIVCSGMTSMDENGETFAPNDAAAQTRQILTTLRKTLAGAGATLDDVISIRVFSTDMRNREAINAERLKFFREPLPASTHIQISRLVEEDRLLEIEALAVVPSDRESPS